MDRPSAAIRSPRPALRWLVWFLYSAAWTTALLTPQPVKVAEAVLPVEYAFVVAKMLHVSAYALLAVLSGWLHVAGPWRWLLLAFLSAHAFGTEYCQGFVPLRTPSLGDVGLDHLGLLLGLAVTWKWWLKTP